MQRCFQEVHAIVADAIKTEHHNHITRVLQDPNFKAIVCVEDEEFNLIPDLPPDNHVPALFTQDENVIIARVEKEIPNVSTIRHEFLHADAHYRHIKKPCETEFKKTTSPITPVTPEMINKLNDAFDKGDRRIQEFERVWLKKKKNTPLSKVEVSLNDPASVIILMPSLIKSKLEVYQSFGEPDHTLLGEREAYTFGNLSPKAAKFFYREAYKLRKEDVEKCTQNTVDVTPRPTR